MAAPAAAAAAAAAGDPHSARVVLVVVVVVGMIMVRRRRRWVVFVQATVPGRRAERKGSPPVSGKMVGMVVGHLVLLRWVLWRRRRLQPVRLRLLLLLRRWIVVVVFPAEDSVRQSIRFAIVEQVFRKHLSEGRHGGSIPVFFFNATENSKPTEEWLG
jgi:hypothetical protein